MLLLRAIVLAPSCDSFEFITGEITVAKPLVAAYPSTVYYMTGFVYDSSACNYGSCQFELAVEFTNHVRFSFQLEVLGHKTWRSVMKKENPWASVQKVKR